MSSKAIQLKTNSTYAQERDESNFSQRTPIG
jgi:hypothetical protein